MREQDEGYAIPSGETRQSDHPPVVLVDDESAFADALAFRLEARGIPVRVYYRGEEALASLDSPELEVVLLDLQMPGLHGLEVLSRIKARRPDVEVVLLTGSADFSVAARGMRRGAGDYLLKPVSFALLLESLEKARKRVLEHKERIRAAEAGRLMALGSLAAGVGHEINNPLQVIIQCAEWLQELAEDAEKGRPDYADMVKTAGVIHKQALKAGAITSQLLDLAHQSRSGKARTRLERLCSKLVSILSERARELNTTFAILVEPEFPLLPCSPAELEPVLHHMLQNALDAIEARQDSSSDGKREPGLIEVRAFATAGTAKITIQDNGEGITPEHAARVFEPFYSTRAIGRGTGLGLTVCHSIITALKGGIDFAPAPGGGTIFSLETPAPPDADAQPGTDTDAT